MTATTVVLATRSRDKLREILQMLPPIDGLRWVTLDEIGVQRTPAEDRIEVFDTFEENALAKARYFSRLSGKVVLADDSGLAVDALDGAPGVRSKRFSGRDDLADHPLDAANNEFLLQKLLDVAVPRTARYVCAIAVVDPENGEHVVRGTVEGEIATRPAGENGFGYDPLFYLADLGATFAQVPSELKNRLSHRRRALENTVPILRSIARRVPDSVERQVS